MGWVSVGKILEPVCVCPQHNMWLLIHCSINTGKCGHRLSGIEDTSLFQQHQLTVRYINCIFYVEIVFESYLEMIHKNIIDQEFFLTNFFLFQGHEIFKKWIKRQQPGGFIDFKFDQKFKQKINFCYKILFTGHNLQKCNFLQILILIKIPNAII